MNDMSARSFWRTVLTFCFLGPPIGAFALLAPVILQAIMAGQLQSALLSVLILVPFYGYVLGLLPAWITGALSSAVSPFIRPWWAWVVTSALIGWAISALVLGFTGLQADEFAAKFWNGYVGGIPALICAWLAQKNRPRPEVPHTAL